MGPFIHLSDFQGWVRHVLLPLFGRHEGERGQALDLKECVVCREENKSLTDSKQGCVPAAAGVAAHGVHLPPCPDSHRVVPEGYHPPSTRPTQPGQWPGAQ